MSPKGQKSSGSAGQTGPIRACEARAEGRDEGMDGTSKFKEQRKTSSAEYTVVDRSPVCLKVGGIVDLGMEDKVWASKQEGRRINEN